MKMRRGAGIVLAVVGFHFGSGLDARAQCCFNDLFAGCGACFRKPPVYAVAPVAAPMMAPMAVPAPPPPVMVPVQQTSYVPETTYRTQYQNVAVTTYKPSSEIDPCTGCPRECMQPVTQYVQQAVNVPVTQYRAVTTTKYVQMQPGYAGGGYPAAQPAMASPAMAPAPAPAASPFAAPVQTAPQGWGAAGADIPQQLVPGSAPPAMPPAGMPQQTYQQPTYQQPAYQQPITPQSGIAMPAAPPAGIQPQPMQQPATLMPTPSLKPIPELPRSTAPATSSAPSGQTYTPSGQTYAPSLSSPTTPVPSAPNGAGSMSGTNGFPMPPAVNGSGVSGSPGTLQPAPVAAPPGMPVLPGQGPKASTNAFPRLLEPTSHTTSWQPAMFDGSPRGRQPGYPTAALPARLQQ